MSKTRKHISPLEWLHQTTQVWRRELLCIFRDEGVFIFVVILCALYPVLYSLIYNTETVRNEPVVVIDNDRSQLSREFARRLNATQEISVVGYAANMQEALELMHRKKCYGIVDFPRDFEACVERGQQGNVSLYCDMSVVMRYKAILMGLTNVQQAMCSERQGKALAAVVAQPESIIESRQIPLGNTAMGIGSAVLLFILPLVLQQSILLAVAMLHGGSIERRRKHGGRDPIGVDATPGATVVGRMLCHLTVYIIPAIYVLKFVPMMFDFPQNGHLLDIMVMTLPFIMACSLMAQTLQAFVNERESVFLVFVFSSVVFVFLTGASWPRYEMSTLWRVVGDCVPAVWMSNAYVLMQSNGATLAQVAHPYHMLWVQVGVMAVLAYLVERFVSRRRYRSWIAVSEQNPKALTRLDMAKNGVG